MRKPPFLVVAAAALLAGCAGTVGGIASPAADLSSFVPSADNPDPSDQIDGIRIETYENAQHVGPDQRVAYTISPPVGGNHDQAWATCNGVVYPQPVRSENLVHSLEHGAVWIAYDPDRVDDAAVDALAARVEGVPYMVLSPFPGMDAPISLQSWGHQLAVDDAADPRIDQFAAALRINRNTHPEFGASCDEVGRGYFDQDSPPPFAPAPDEDDVDGTAVVPE